MLGAGVLLEDDAAGVLEDVLAGVLEDEPDDSPPEPVDGLEVLESFLLESFELESFLPESRESLR